MECVVVNLPEDWDLFQIVGGVNVEFYNFWTIGRQPLITDYFPDFFTQLLPRMSLFQYRDRENIYSYKYDF